MKAALGASAAVLAAVLAWLWFAWWLPNARLRDLEWRETHGTAAIVRESRKVLRLPFGNHHDACLWIEEHGNADAVPDLITALRWMPDTGEDGIMVCTKGHCLEALRRLTGADPGPDHRDWRAWSRAQPRGRRRTSRPGAGSPAAQA